MVQWGKIHTGTEGRRLNSVIDKSEYDFLRTDPHLLDILEKGEIITYREADHDLLMSIRKGAYQREDHTYAPEFFELVSQYKKRLDYAKNNTGLPEHPDMKQIEEFMIHVNESVVRGEI